MRSHPPLKALQAFETAARLGSVKLAADELSVTPSAISHQIRTLEDFLGVPLFHRTNRRVLLTDTGRGYLQFVGGAFERIDMATRKLIEDGFTDILTVHCAPSFAPAWLMPRLPQFLRTYPDIDLRLHATPEPCDFVRGNVDVEIRYGEGEWPGLKAHRLMNEMVTPMCSPHLSDALPKPPSPEHLSDVQLIHSERCSVNWAEWFNANGIDGVNVTRGLRFDRGYLSIQAAVDGLGFALESTVFAGRELSAGILVMPLLERSISPEVPSHYLVYPEATGTIPKIQKFRDWILSEASGDS